jgi:predicted membrane-bound spermidine synthase
LTHSRLYYKRLYRSSRNGNETGRLLTRESSNYKTWKIICCVVRRALGIYQQQIVGT